MATKTFMGGIHPPESKERSTGNSIEVLRKVTQVVIPVNQHFGPPMEVLVKVGDVVRRGQKIADGQGFLMAPLHASISGTVKKIEPRVLANNQEGPCIIIEPNDDTQNDFMPVLDPFTCTKEEALKRVREAGIIGVGGAGFPAHVKYAPPAGTVIDYVIANAAECEPFLTIDERVMAEDPEDFIDGIAIVMKITGAKKGVIGLENNKEFLVEGLEKAIKAKSNGMDISVQLLVTKYPQGGEKMLISAITGREVPSGGLPANAGCIVSNVGTLRNVSEAFRQGKPVVDTGLTITGGACENPKNVFVPVGMLVQDLFPDVARVEEDKLKRIVMGGPMMGPAIPSFNVPIQKNTSGVLLMDEKEAKAYTEGPCLRCGSCMKSCPCRISPALLNKALEADDLEEAGKIGIMDCIECGSCSFICPSHIQLVQRFRIGKQKYRALLAKKKEAQNAGK